MANEDLVPIPTQPGWFGKLLAALMNPFKFLKDVLSHNGIGSSKRTVMFVSAMVLCTCLVALTGAIMWVLVHNPKDHKIDGNIVLLYTALTVPIATLAGAAYIKKSEELQTVVPQSKPIISNSTTTTTTTPVPGAVPPTSSVKKEVQVEG